MLVEKKINLMCKKKRRDASRLCSGLFLENLTMSKNFEAF